MITIGLDTWSDHPVLAENSNKKVSLKKYSEYFPTVEVDSPFYGIPTEKIVKNWQKQVPSEFQFVLKANYLMTKHHLKKFADLTEESTRAAFSQYYQMVKPLVEARQLKTILFQFPPYFQLTLDNIKYLQMIREWMGNLPISVEFRNSSWYGNEISHDTNDYLKSLKMTQVVVDEPHSLKAGVPFEPVVTNKQLVLLRLHGRNQKGWFGDSNADNPKLERTNYNYKNEELSEIIEAVNSLKSETNEVCIIFNNNGNHDAGPNALKFKDDLGLEFGGLSPMQLDLF